jgi:ABC-type maltose transport system permease subunit
MAGALLASIPIVIVYVVFLDYYVSGLTAGAVRADAAEKRAHAKEPPQ